MTNEIQFDILNATDKTTLFGRYWPAQKPVAMMTLIHGLGEHCGRYVEMVAALNAGGISVCAVDLHGHGNTPGKRGVCRDYSLMHGDVTALLTYAKEQADGLPQFLFGHSMGGGIVLSYALNNVDLKLSGVIAQAPLIQVVDGPPAFLKTIMRGVIKVAPDFAIKAKLDGTKISTLSEEQKKYEADPLNHTYLGAGLALDMMDAGQRTASRAARFTYPLLLTHGDQDVLTSFEASQAFAAQVPNCKFICYPGSAHEIHNDFCRAQVHDDLSSWILSQV